MIAKLSQLVEQTVDRLSGTPEGHGDQRLKRRPWSRKEAAGHLIDWATTHDDWFVRALTEPNLLANGYPQDDWVSVQRYNAYGWPELVYLWGHLNRLLVHVLVQIPEEKLSAVCRIGITAPMPLKNLIAEYVSHCEDIVGQIMSHG